MMLVNTLGSVLRSDADAIWGVYTYHVYHECECCLYRNAFVVKLLIAHIYNEYRYGRSPYHGTRNASAILIDPYPNCLVELYQVPGFARSLQA